MRIRVQLISMRIRIQGARPIRNQANTDPNPGQTLKSQKVEFLHEKYRSKYVKKHAYEGTWYRTKAFLKGRKPRVYLWILVNFHAPESGSVFPIRIRIQDNQMNADPNPQLLRIESDHMGEIYLNCPECHRSRGRLRPYSKASVEEADD